MVSLNTSICNKHRDAETKDCMIIITILMYHLKVKTLTLSNLDFHMISKINSYYFLSYL
jgi:hypothetical protein